MTLPKSLQDNQSRLRDDGPVPTRLLGVRMERGWLIAAGVLNAGAALLHLACILGGPAWYRFLGAGERMARLAERGSLRPALITIGIATVLGFWSAYAFSGAGMLPRLPMLRPALIAICMVF